MKATENSRKGGRRGCKKKEKTDEAGRKRKRGGWSNREVSRVGLAYYEYKDRLRMKLKLT